MPTLIRSPFRLPESVDALTWRRAEGFLDELERASPEAAPSTKEVHGFSKACVKKYSNELNFLLIRIQLLFRRQLPNAQRLKEGINYFKYRLKAKLISPQDLPQARKMLSEALPTQVTPAERATDMRDRLTEASQKALFLQRLANCLPTSIFQRKCRSLRERAQKLFDQCHELVEVRDTVDQVRQVQSCLAKMQALDIRRNALFEQMGALSGQRSEYSRLCRIQGAMDQIRLDYICLSREVEAAHEEFPDLFTLDLQALGSAIRNDYLSLMSLLSKSAPRPMESVARHLGETLARVSFRQLLDPRSDARTYIGHCAYHYHAFGHVMQLPDEYGKAYTLDATIKCYKSLERALLANNYLMHFSDLELLAELGEADLAPLRHLFEKQALPFIKQRTPQMQRRLLRHFNDIFSKCPALLSSLVARELRKLAAKLPPTPEIDHMRHEHDLRASMCKETKLCGLQFVAQHIRENTLDQISFQELYRFRDVYSPNYEFFQHIIIEKLESLSQALPFMSIPAKELVNFIAYVQEMVSFCPQLNAGHRVSDSIQNALRYRLRDQELLTNTHVRFSTKDERCLACVKEKVSSDQLELLTLEEISCIRYGTDERRSLKEYLQHILDTSTPEELLIWREDHFDPFIQRFNLPAKKHETKLLDLDFVDAFMKKTMEAKILANRWDKLDENDIYVLCKKPNPSTQAPVIKSLEIQKFFKEHARFISNPVARNRLIKWKKDVFDPYIKDWEERDRAIPEWTRRPHDLRVDQEFLAALKLVAFDSSNSPSLWEWICFFLAELLRNLRG